MIYAFIIFVSIANIVAHYIISRITTKFIKNTGNTVKQVERIELMIQDIWDHLEEHEEIYRTNNEVKELLIILKERNNERA